MKTFHRKEVKNQTLSHENKNKNNRIQLQYSHSYTTMKIIIFEISLQTAPADLITL